MSPAEYAKAGKNDERQQADYCFLGNNGWIKARIMFIDAQAFEPIPSPNLEGKFFSADGNCVGVNDYVMLNVKTDRSHEYHPGVEKRYRPGKTKMKSKGRGDLA